MILAARLADGPHGAQEGPAVRCPFPHPTRTGTCNALLIIPVSGSNTLGVRMECPRCHRWVEIERKCA